MAADLVDPAQSQSTYYGGSVDDWPNVLTVVADPGDVYIAGSTTSADLPGTAGGAQPDAVMEPEAFVALFDDTLAGGVAPEIEVSPPSHDFGTVDAGARSGPVEFTIRNVGTDELIITEISNSDATNFVVVTNGGSNGCSAERPFTLAPDTSCTFTADFAPSAGGEFSAAVTIESNDLDEGTLSVPLTGVGASGNGGNDGQGDDSGGCGCTTPGRPLGSTPVSVALSLGLVFLFSRRRRKRRHSPESGATRATTRN